METQIVQCIMRNMDSIVIHGMHMVHTIIGIMQSTECIKISNIYEETMGVSSWALMETSHGEYWQHRKQCIFGTIWSWHGIVDELRKSCKGSMAISSHEKQKPMTIISSSMP